MVQNRSPTARSVWRLGEILIQKEWIDWGELAQALKAQRIRRDLLGEILVAQRYIDRKRLIRALAIQYGVPFVELKSYLVEKSSIVAVSKHWVVQHHFMPLEISRSTLLIAVSNPFNHYVRAILSEETGGREVQIALALPEDIDAAIRKYYRDPRAAA